MPTTEELLQQILNQQRRVDTRLERIETILDERCHDHQRQLDRQQGEIDGIRRRSAQNQNGHAWMDPRFWTAIATALVALGTALAALLGVK